MKQSSADVAVVCAVLFFRLVQIHDPAENPKNLTCHLTVPKQEAVNAAIQNVEAGRFTRLNWSLRSSSSAPERLTSAEINIADLA